MVGTAAQRKETHGLRVLLVDDRKLVRETTSDGLQRHGHQVLTAKDAETALELLETADVDLALVDVVMPGGADGLFLLARLRAEHPQLPVLVYSGEDREDLPKKAVQLGAVDFVRKPFKPAELNRLLVRSVARCAAQAAAREGLLGGGKLTGQGTDVDDRQRVLEALQQNRWHLGRTAVQLGISYSTLRRKIKIFGL